MFTVYIPSRKIMIVIVVCVAIASILFASIQIVRSSRARSAAFVQTSPQSSSLKGEENGLVTELPPQPAVIVRVPLPSEVRGIYWTAFTAATKRADELIEYMKKTELNTVVID